MITENCIKSVIISLLIFESVTSQINFGVPNKRRIQILKSTYNICINDQIFLTKIIHVNA
jgi:hypothetical protein